MKKYIALTVGLCIFILGIAFAYVANKLEKLETATLDVSFPFAFEISPGDTIYSVTNELQSIGAIQDVWRVKLMARLGKIPYQLKVGEYRVEQAVSYIDLLKLFDRGEVVSYSLTFPEGWNVKQIIEEIQQHPKLQQTIQDSSFSQLSDLLQLEGVSPEGWIFPDTYHYVKGQRDIDILFKANTKMKRILEKHWSSRNKKTMSAAIETPYDALILASIIEKESSVGGDRDLISSVFHNRLNRGMRLQTDPTVIYAMGESYRGNIRRSDLRIDSPFNTYLHKGLPPTPIAMPGEASIVAALNPKVSEYLYFVAKGDGYHKFSKSLKEHNKAVREFQIRNRSKQYRSTPK